MEWEQKKGKKLTYFTIPEWEKAGLEIGFSARGGGLSQPPYDSLNLGLHVGDEPEAVLGNRQLWWEEWNADGDDAVMGEQVHGNRVMWVDRTAGGRGSRAMQTAIQGIDGLITADSVALMAMYADCVPLFFYHPTLGTVALAHAGWRGTVHKIGKAVIDELEKAGGRAEDVWVGIGPAIGPCCYQVDEQVADEVAANIGRGPWLVPDEGATDHYRLDLARANEEILLKAGVKAPHIWNAGLCTACRTQDFFSYRRDGKRSGRMAGWIRLKERMA